MFATLDGELPHPLHVRWGSLASVQWTLSLTFRYLIIIFAIACL